jgi:hypothetical protein
LTAKRRTRLLAERGLVIADPRKFFAVTPAGIEALGPDAQPPPRWVNVAAISAASAKDVRERLYVSDITAARAVELRQAGEGRRQIEPQPALQSIP